MIYVRTRYLCACVAASDTTMIAGGVPLQRYSWGLVHNANADIHAIALALVANLALLALALFGLSSAFVIARRGAWYFLRRYAVGYARSTIGQRMRIGR
ncbi:MAG: hypothetical protein ABR508_09485 [Candidatus Baltobacteraceae bacterium]